jgi:aarF domain-containing kinase
MDDWLRLLQSRVDGNREQCARYSLKLGYLTGNQSEVRPSLGGVLIAHPLQEMVDAHVQSILLLAISFQKETRQTYNFEDQTVSEEIRGFIPFKLQNRLTPPLRETYSLNRKLLGAFLLCGRLKARVDCAGIWEEVTRGYEFTRSDET